MMKWFRKYNRHMMAGLVVFLMISFLIQDSLTRQSDRQRVRDFGYVKGELVDARQFESAIATRSILEWLGLPWNMPWYMQGAQLPLQPLKVDSFTLLLLEARNAQVEVSEGDVDRVINTYFMSAGGAPRLDAIRRQHDLKMSDIRAAIGDYLRILRYADAVTSSVHVSEDQLRHYVRDTTERVRFAYVQFPAEKFVDPTQTFAEAELQAQFDQYRDVSAPMDGSGMGYKWPQRVRLEYLSINSADLKPSIKVTEEQARRYFQEHKSEYVRMLPPLASQPAATTSSAPASAPSSAPVRRQMLFREARAEVEDKVRDERARARAKELMDLILSDLDRPWVLGRGDDGFQRRPAGVDASGFLENLATQFTNRFRITVSYHRTELMSQRDFSKGDAALGRARSADTSAGARDLATAAFDVQNFAAPKKDADATVESLALYQPSNNVYLIDEGPPKGTQLLVFRVTDAHQPEPPARLDEVRDKVIADLRLIHADLIADGLASRLYAAARIGGLRAAVAADPQLKDRLTKPSAGDLGMPAHDPVVETPPLARRYAGFDFPVSVPGLGQSQNVLDAAFAMSDRNWEAPPASAPATQIAATQPAVAATQPAPRVQLVEIPRSHNRVVMQFVSLEPVREDQYDSQRASAVAALTRQRRQDCLRQWYDIDAIARRMQYKPPGREGGPDANS